VTDTETEEIARQENKGCEGYDQREGREGKPDQQRLREKRRRGLNYGYALERSRIWATEGLRRSPTVRQLPSKKKDTKKRNDERLKAGDEKKLRNCYRERPQEVIATPRRGKKRTKTSGIRLWGTSCANKFSVY